LQIASTEAAFLRGLYVDGIKAYATQQAQGLRQAYLLLFEPESSIVLEATTKGFADRLDLARQLVMRPLRDHLGILDEETIHRIYDIQTILLQAPDRVKEQKQKFFQETDSARQFVKVGEIARRLGLITQPFEKRATSK
jgi:hypothetical protein